MVDFDDAFVQALETQSWSLYGVGMFMILLRLFARVRRLGARSLQADDYVMLLAGAPLYTTLVASLNLVAQGGGSNLYAPGLEATFTPAEVSARVRGSKLVVVSEQAMLNLVYAVKACVLVLYGRLMAGVAGPRRRAVRWLAAYVAAGWAGSQVAFWASCRPVAGYWAVPPPDAQCATLARYSVVQGCLNVSGDVLMLLAVPLPLVLGAALPARQKVVLAFVLGLGLFVVAAALLTKAFNLTDVWDPAYMLWYVREASVAVYVANLPLIWPLLREWFPVLSGLTPGGTSSGRERGGTHSTRNLGDGGAFGRFEAGMGTRTERSGMGRRQGGRRPDSLGSLDSAFDLGVVGKDAGDAGGKSEAKESGKYGGGESSSTERIIGVGDAGGEERITRGGGHDSIGIAVSKMGGIQVERTVEVLEERNGTVRKERGEYCVDVGVEWR